MDTTIVTIITFIVSGIAAMLISRANKNKRDMLERDLVAGQQSKAQNDAFSETYRNNYEDIENWKELHDRFFDVLGWPDVTFGPASIDKVKELAPWNAQAASTIPVMSPYDFLFLYYEARILVGGLDAEVVKADDINRVLIAHYPCDNGFVFAFTDAQEPTMLHEGRYTTDEEYTTALEKFGNFSVEVRHHD
ncbi:MAG: hypothetical protein MJZ74_00425 [Muribaculaceae bacterium]|nr:hypothetical protein [Muribaculaceae bacterium]